jgi:hypothetical protein
LRKTTVKKYTKGDFERFMMTGKTPPGIQNGQPIVTVKSTTDTVDYHIEKGVPVPQFHNLSEFPLLDMEVGDSFVAPLSKIKALRNAITRIHKRNDTLRFITRTVNGRGRAGRITRVWRVSTTH